MRRLVRDSGSAASTNVASRFRTAPYFDAVVFTSRLPRARAHRPSSPNRPHNHTAKHFFLYAIMGERLLGKARNSMSTVQIDLNRFTATTWHVRNRRPSSEPYRRHRLREIVPLADSTIHEMEQRGEFPRQFALSARCIVWDLAEVEAWLEARRSRALARAPHPDVRQRRTRPIKGPVRAATAASSDLH